MHYSEMLVKCPLNVDTDMHTLMRNNPNSTREFNILEGKCSSYIEVTQWICVTNQFNSFKRLERCS